MVQRYDLKEDCVTGHIDLEKDADGDWVRYGDYKELDDDFQDYITTTDMEIEGLVARLAEVNAELSGLKEWRAQVIDVALKASEEARTKIDNLEAELQKYKDQFPDYVECANCGSVTHVEGVE